MAKRGPKETQFGHGIRGGKYITAEMIQSMLDNEGVPHLLYSIMDYGEGPDDYYAHYNVLKETARRAEKKFKNKGLEFVWKCGSKKRLKSVVLIGYLKPLGEPTETGHFKHGLFVYDKRPRTNIL